MRRELIGKFDQANRSLKRRYKSQTGAQPSRLPPLSTMQARTLALQSRSLPLPVLAPSRTQSQRPQREPVTALFVLKATRSHGSLFCSPAATLVVDVRGFAIGVIGWSDCAGTRRKPSMRDSQYSLKGEYITPPCRAE